MNVTAALALKLVPGQLRSQLVFLCVDDTMVSQFGTKFENVSNLFDHAAHYGSNYLSGHCFVSLMLCVPVWAGRKVVYQSVPLGYRIWQKKESKLDLAASMIRQVMPELRSEKNVVILCDSWYARILSASWMNIPIWMWSAMPDVIPLCMTCPRNQPEKEAGRQNMAAAFLCKMILTCLTRKSVIIIQVSAVSSHRKSPMPC